MKKLLLEDKFPKINDPTTPTNPPHSSQEPQSPITTLNPILSPTPNTPTSQYVQITPEDIKEIS